ncbi:MULTISPECIES: single-stranded DNA-binding protein [Weeksellaceae]|uniref:Single-stranded DNA-binding protein n=2 Tax=Elizabethkingia TaxID=308865 RepID=A0ABX3NE49_9FLAO|nr:MULTISPECIES: single-stranded DNA-binding protein [Weeksellaceae]HAY3555610.1 single-stranded DNA-binding protein [Elizabethkingia meningoseptica]MBE9393756.1 single-stranded DNA-binding protein [Elizabethkingia anophelis]MBE9405643.1 single-stranded DNA-binding protein [Elizabethkingia anophelis]MDV3663826.1 single-stranded DNA-binding protein [Elizabethkingia anophelis]OPB94370.1 single-stranded DNA-binding protein [Elizabethkingia ursingii]
MNTVIGRITKNAEIKTLNNNKKVVNFSVATHDSYKTKEGERKKQTTYFNCSYWLSPNVAKILTKGALVELSGRVSSSAWIGKDGEIRSGLNFHTSSIKLHSSGKNSESEPKQNAQVETIHPFAGDTDDDLPF